MMPTLMILGGMLMMLAPLINIAAPDLFGISAVLRRAYHANVDVPDDMREKLKQLEGRE